MKVTIELDTEDPVDQEYIAALGKALKLSPEPTPEPKTTRRHVKKDRRAARLFKGATALEIEMIKNFGDVEYRHRTDMRELVAKIGCKPASASKACTRLIRMGFLAKDDMANYRLTVPSKLKLERLREVH